MSDTALVVMARAPEEGKVKTRLAAGIGSKAALQLYQSFLTDLALRFSEQAREDIHYTLNWAYTPPEIDFRSLITALVPDRESGICFPQCGADLGARLHQVFHSTHARSFQRTIVISSDSPQVSHTLIEQARRALDVVDVVLGPAEDGGYYLIAMRHPYDLFSGIPMSTSQVLPMTIERARGLGFSVSLLEELFDIDDWSDLQRMMGLLAGRPELAPATAACLASYNFLAGARRAGESVHL